MVIHFAIRPYNVILEGEGAATAPTGDAPCPGLVRQNAAAKMTDFIGLLEMVDDEGAEARGLGLGLMSTNGNIHKCIACWKKPGPSSGPHRLQYVCFH